MFGFKSGKFSILFIILLISFIQNSCTVLWLGAALTTGTIVAIQQDRSLGNTIDDTSIVIKINKELLKHHLFSNIRVKVSESRVLLIGNVKNREEQLLAEKIAWQQQGVKEVINEIIVNYDTKSYTLANLTKDGFITTQLIVKILPKSKIKSINYSVNTINGIVYLMGIAQSKEELNNILSLARIIKGVKQVVSYVRLKDSKLRN